MRFVGIEVVIIAIVGADVLIWVYFWVVSSGGTFDTAGQERLARYETLQDRMALTICRSEDRMHTSESIRSAQKLQHW